MGDVILLEFNELCPSLLDDWIAAGKLPNFRRLYSESEIYVTEADEANPAHLEPWIQWYSLHTGLPFNTHQVFHLTDGPEACHPDIWHILRDAGKTVWNCSSMNTRRIQGLRAIYLPDPWCDSGRAYPDEMQPFSWMISHLVKEYSNSNRKMPIANLARFSKFLITHGLSWTTIRDTIFQIMIDIKSQGKTSWKRVTILDKILYDVFAHYYKNANPDFSTFFVNSTAHLQHAYWRHMAPQCFTVKPPAEEIERYKDAVLFGYKEMDCLVGRFLQLVRPGTTVVLVTALSQQPYLKYEAIGGHRFYRPHSVTRLLQQLEIAPMRVEPVMTHQFLARFRSQADRDRALNQLKQPAMNSVPIFGFDSSDSESIFFGCQIRTPVAADALVDLGTDAGQTRFFDLFYMIDGIKSGRHHPDGCLWIRRGSHARHARKVSILDVVPTVLDLFNLPASGLPGHSLLHQVERDMVHA